MKYDRINKRVGRGKMKKCIEWVKKHIRLILIVMAFLIPLIVVHLLFRSQAKHSCLEAVWSAGDIIAYVMSFFTLIGTVHLGYTTALLSDKNNKISERLMRIEENRDAEAKEGRRNIVDIDFSDENMELFKDDVVIVPLKNINPQSAIMQIMRLSYNYQHYYFDKDSKKNIREEFYNQDECRVRLGTILPNQCKCDTIILESSQKIEEDSDNKKDRKSLELTYQALNIWQETNHIFVKICYEDHVLKEYIITLDELTKLESKPEHEGRNN